jgi:hypothetical protein
MRASKRKPRIPQGAVRSRLAIDRRDAEGWITNHKLIAKKVLQMASSKLFRALRAAPIASPSEKRDYREKTPYDQHIALREKGFASSPFTTCHTISLPW